VISLVEARQSVRIPIIASGGIRNGIDIAKALALKADLAGLSQPLLKATLKGTKETKKVLTSLIEELKNTMFLVGAKSVQALITTPLVITGFTAEWLKLRGFSLESYLSR
jgi:isopentenyl-diphosphate delta-isomerase